MLEAQLEISYDNDQWSAPLRCPACGSRGEGARLWMMVDVGFSLDRPDVVFSPMNGDVDIECGACEHHGPVRSFSPPWTDPTGVALTTAGPRRVFDDDPVRILSDAEQLLSDRHLASHLGDANTDER